MPGASASAQTDLHSAHVGIEFQIDRVAAQVEDDAFAVLQPDARCSDADTDATPTAV
jgi:hypothetical protein